ncbi:hypothetical protein BVY04_00990 [bacterium M21]|nr:hypothetical protein BVY04_00990 [bacterium M21]
MIHTENKNVAMVLVIIVAVIFTLLLVSDVDVRMATTTADDSILTHAEYNKNPHIFRDDFAAKSMSDPSLLSAMNFVPALAYEYLDVPPKMFYLPIVLLQNVLLALGIFLLSRHISKDIRYNLLAVGLYLLVLPQFKNIADYGGLLWMPYAGHLAQGLILIAISTFLSGRKNASICLLIISGFIHPMQTIQAIGLVAFLSIIPVVVRMWKDKVRNLKDVYVNVTSETDTIMYIVGLSLVVLLVVAYFSIGSSFSVEISGKDLTEKIAKNGHISPSFERISYSLAFMGAMALMLVYSIREGYYDRKQLTLLAGTTFLLVVYTGLHFLSIKFLVVDGMRFLGTRFSQIWLLMVLPYFAYMLFRRCREGVFIEIFAIVYVCLVQMKYGQPVPVALLALLAASFYVTPSLFSWAKFMNKYVIFVIVLSVNSVAFYYFAKIFISAQKSFPSLSLQGTTITLYVMFLASHSILRSIPHKFVSPLLKAISFLSALSFVYFALYLRIHTGTKYPDVGAVMIVLLIAVVSAFLISGTWKSTRLKLMQSYLMIVIPIAFTWQAFSNSYKDGIDHVTNKYYDYCQLQKWTQLHTKQSDVFVLLDGPSYYGWRGYTGRALLTKYVSSPYCYPKDGLDFRYRLYLFFKEQHKLGHATSSSIDFSVLKRLGFLALKDEFNVKYVVAKSSRKLDLEVAFVSNNYKLYRIPSERLSADTAASGPTQLKAGQVVP